MKAKDVMKVLQISRSTLYRYTALREKINFLESKKAITLEESELLSALINYRQSHYSYPGLAYYSSLELYSLFN